MERRNFIKNTGLGIAGLALSNSIYSKNTSTKKSLEIFILLSGGVCFNDVLDPINNKILSVINQDNNFEILCKTKINYSGDVLEHSDAMFNALNGLNEIASKNIFISNQNSLVTNKIANSNLPLTVVTTNAKNNLSSYRNDLAVFEKAYQYFDSNENIRLILNLEDTDIAHCNGQKYFDVLEHYSFQITKLCNQLFSNEFSNKCQTSITVASVIGRNNFNNDIYSEKYHAGTDHYHESARALFSFQINKSALSNIRFDHTKYDSKDMIVSNKMS
jgi:hypothetical protein